MIDSMTAGAQRALERSASIARLRSASQIEPIDLLAALMEETESLALARLREFQVDPNQILDRLGRPEANGSSGQDESNVLPHSATLRFVLSEATGHARSVDRGRGVGTEHLLWGLASSGGTAAEILEGAGLHLSTFLDRLEASDQLQLEPIPFGADDPTPDLSAQIEAVDVGRILDASANRAQEALRVIDDYVRFVLGDPMLTRRMKEIRHRLGEALRGLDDDLLLTSRDTTGDVGTHIMTAAEQTRENARGVLTANFRRATEALRSLEEYTKLINVWISGRFEVLRYDLYTMEKMVVAALVSHQRLGDARLCVLVGGLPTLGELSWIVGEALAGGAEVIQLREKGISDRVFLERAREVRILTAQAKARFIVNDRPDLARLAGADGVHLGQEDVRPRDARRVIGSAALLGISTHEPEQIERALLDGAGYLGVGPVYASKTKEFASFAGLEFVRHAAETSTLPWFAIGGIDADNIDAVLDAGAQRIAVSSAVVYADSPREATKALRAKLDERG
jgi:thiamine-phosphate pyrophosphorylase